MRAFVSLSLAVLAVHTLLPAQTQNDTDPLRLLLDVADDRTAGPVEAIFTAGLESERLIELCAARHGRTETGIAVQFDSVATAAGPALRMRFVAASPLPKGEHELTVRFDGEPAELSFTFRDDTDHRSLSRGDRTVYRFEHAFDLERLDETYKPFHHVFAPDGETLLTKGAGGHYTHHRGLFLGYGTATRGEDSFDFWHCKDGVSQRWRRPPTGDIGMAPRTGGVTADAIERIEWCDATGDPVVEELRRITAWDVGDDAITLDVEARLRVAGTKPVSLAGDPHHSGFQFRAADEVHDHQESTSYVRSPAAQGGDNDVWTDCRWAACRLTVDGEEFVVQHHSHPENPGPWLYSTRAYGRFGSYGPTTLEPNQTTVIRHRIIVTHASHADEHPADEAYRAFVTPIRARAVRGAH